MNKTRIESIKVLIDNIKRKGLVALVVTSDGEKVTRRSNKIAEYLDALKEHLNGKLTYYMVPTVYMELDEMPQTLNGKTDLRNLPEPVLITEYVAPGLYAMFFDVLDVEKDRGLEELL